MFCHWQVLSVLSNICWWSHDLTWTLHHFCKIMSYLLTLDSAESVLLVTNTLAYSAVERLQKSFIRLAAGLSDPFGLFRNQIYLKRWLTQTLIQKNELKTFVSNMNICYFGGNYLKVLRRSDRTAITRHLCRKMTVLSCHRCLIFNSIEKLTKLSYRLKYRL